MESFKIWCETREERDKVMEKMAKDGITWSETNNCKPRAGDTAIPPYQVGFIVEENTVSWTPYVLGFANSTVPENTVQDYLEEKIKMTKSDLKTGYIVTTRDGIECVVYLNVATIYSGLRENVLVGKNYYWLRLDNYNEDLTHPDNSSYDIVKVEKSFHPYCLQDLDYEADNRQKLWEREEPKVKELTIDEATIILKDKLTEFDEIKIVV